MTSVIPFVSVERDDAASLLSSPSEGHLVHFYEDEELLFDAVARFLGAGLQAGDHLIVIATPEHRKVFVQRLKNLGVDSAIAEGSLVFFDARETLAKFMVNGSPNRERFRHALADILRRATGGRKGVRTRVYGEMVDLLWQDGARSAAIELEELWNGARSEHAFPLLCAYAMANFYKDGGALGVDDVCRAHSHVLGAVPSPAAEIARLQERIKALELENEQLREIQVAMRGSVSERLHERETRFRLFIESVKDYAIFLLDPSGNITSWNSGAERIKGYKAEEIVGRHFSTFYPTEDVQAGKCEHGLTVAMKEGRFEDEGWRLRKDETRFWANVVITPVYSKAGELLGFGKVTRDLTAHLEAEEEHIRLARAEEEHREIQRTAEFRERFIGIVSHDLRNPLNSIMMSASLMVRSPELPPQLARTVGRILSNGERIAGMVSDLLDFTRGRLGEGIPVAPTAIDLEPIAVQVVDELEQVHPSRRILYEARGNTLGVWDGPRIGQVISNLVGNALEHGEPERPVRVALDAGVDVVRVSVHNEGTPIPPDVIERVFDPFCRGGSKVSGGLGLGLFIASEITRAHGGTINVTSSDGGTTFTVSLPRDAVPFLGPASS